MINKIRSLIKRGIISLLAEDTGDFQIIQVDYLGKTSKFEAIFPFGTGGNPPEGSSVLLFNVEGQEENKAGIATLPKDRFKFNEVHAWTGNPVAGTYIVFRENGDIQEIVKNNRTITIDKDMNITISGNKSETVTGNSAETLTGTKDIDATGVITINSNSTVNVVAPSVNLGSSGGTLRKLIDDRIINNYNNHVHSGVTPGVSNSGAPSNNITGLTTSDVSAS
jgi:phage gp45-like